MRWPPRKDTHAHSIPTCVSIMRARVYIVHIIVISSKGPFFFPRVYVYYSVLFTSNYPVAERLRCTCVTRNTRAALHKRTLLAREYARLCAASWETSSWSVPVVIYRILRVDVSSKGYPLVMCSPCYGRTDGRTGGPTFYCHEKGKRDKNAICVPKSGPAAGF